MKFTCEKAVLNEAISICIHAVATKSTIAVLEGLLITAEDELTLCGYNFKTGIKKHFLLKSAKREASYSMPKSSAISYANCPTIWWRSSATIIT